MILIGFGGNMPSSAGAVPATLRAALALMPDYGISPRTVSPFYRAAPVPVSDQPWFVNGVAVVESARTPSAIMAALLQIEKKFGRVRGEKNAARTLDLDLLDYEGKIIADEGLMLPHPRMHARAFVLLPLRDVMPAWRHPVTGAELGALIAALPPEQKTEKIF